MPTYLPTYCGPLPVCFNGFEGAVSAPCRRVANAPFFGLPELGFRWCLALPTSFIFVFVQVRLPHVFCLPNGPPTAVLYLSVLTVSKVQFQHRVDGLRTHRFLACLSSDLGGVWLFRILCRRASFLPLSRLPTAVLYLSVLTVSKVQFQHRVEGLRTRRFLACLSSDLGGVWLFRIRCRRAAFLPLSRLGCPTFFAYLLAHLLRSFTCLF